MNDCFEPQLQHLESTALHVFARTHWKVIYQVSHLGPGAEWALEFREAIFIILHIYLFPKRLLTSRLLRILTYTWSGRPWGNFSCPNGNYTLIPKLLLTPKNFSRMKGMVQEFKLKKKSLFLEEQNCSFMLLSPFPFTRPVATHCSKLRAIPSSNGDFLSLPSTSLYFSKTLDTLLRGAQSVLSCE